MDASPDPIHPLLARQLRRLGLDGACPDLDPGTWAGFLDRIDRTYRQADQDRVLLERSLELSSEEIRKLYEKRIQSSESQTREEADKLRAVITSLGAGLAVLDLAGKLVSLNPEGAALLGTSEDELKGKPLFDLVMSEGSPVDLTESRVPTLLAGGATVAEEDASFLRTDGARLPVTYSLRLLTAGEAVIGSVLVFADITHRKRLETVRDQFFELSEDLLAVLDHRGNLRQGSVGWRKVFGYSSLEVSRLNMHEILHPDDRGVVLRQMARYRRGTGGFRFEVRLRTADGSYRWIAWHASAVRDDEVFYAIGRDVTRRRRSEAELRRALERAEAGERAKSEFLANMSHELRTPLHGILSYARLGLKKRDTASPEKLAKYFGSVLRSGESLLELLNDLLDLSKLEAGRFSFDLRAGDLGATVAMVVDEFRPLSQERSITLALDRDDDGEPALFDRERIVQVVRNLLSNAVKFTADGSEVRCTVSRWGRWVRLTVEDRGPGIPDAELTEIFDKFIQSSVTRSGAGGTGLGLAICAEILAGHGGSIVAENRPDGGARLVALLPAAGAVDDSGEAESRPAA